MQLPSSKSLRFERSQMHSIDIYSLVACQVGKRPKISTAALFGGLPIIFKWFLAFVSTNVLSGPSEFDLMPLTYGAVLLQTST